MVATRAHRQRMYQDYNDLSFSNGFVRQNKTKIAFYDPVFIVICTTHFNIRFEPSPHNLVNVPINGCNKNTEATDVSRVHRYIHVVLMKLAGFLTTQMYTLYWYEY